MNAAKKGAFPMARQALSREVTGDQSGCGVHVRNEILERQGAASRYFLLFYGLHQTVTFFKFKYAHRARVWPMPPAV
jgi:hypothetical protein